MTIDRSALVLNQNFEPLNVCSVRRAFVLVDHGKAEVLEAAKDGIRGVDRVYQTPSVIRLHHFVRRPRPRVRLTRREVFARDEGRCQYCGLAESDLTLDHVIPRHRGGRHDWDNIVAACRRCNHRKGGRTPAEAHMRLTRSPRQPTLTPAEMFTRYLEGYREWRPFVVGWLDVGKRARYASERA